MRSVLSIDVANGKSEVLFITEHGEILIEPYEVKHCLSEFNLLKERIDNFNLNDLTIIHLFGIYPYCERNVKIFRFLLNPRFYS